MLTNLFRKGTGTTMPTMKMWQPTIHCQINPNIQYRTRSTLLQMKWKSCHHIWPTVKYSLDWCPHCSASIVTATHSHTQQLSFDTKLHLWHQLQPHAWTYHFAILFFKKLCFSCYPGHVLFSIDILAMYTSALACLHISNETKLHGYPHNSYVESILIWVDFELVVLHSKQTHSYCVMRGVMCTWEERQLQVRKDMYKFRPRSVSVSNCSGYYY